MKNLNNQVQLIGHLGAAPEVMSFGDRKMVKFSLATNSFRKDAEGEFQQKTQWHNVIAWGKVAEQLEQSVEKGSKLLVRGTLEQRTWKDKQGKNRKSAEIKVQEFIRLERFKKSEDVEAEAPVFAD